MSRQVIDELVREVALKFNLKPTEAERMINHQFKFLHDTMQSGEFKTVMLHHIGKFWVSRKKKLYWQEKLAKQKDGKGAEDIK